VFYIIIYIRYWYKLKKLKNVLLKKSQIFKQIKVFKNIKMILVWYNFYDYYYKLKIYIFIRDINYIFSNFMNNINI
jgi:hypothetical protein